MGNDTSKATGTDFQKNQQSREADNAADDLPSIPFLKAKAISASMNKLVKDSIWMANYKRAFRGYLRRRPERNQQGTMLRIHTEALRDGDKLGLPANSYRELIKQLVETHADMWIEDAIEFLKERGKIAANAKDDEQRKIALENIALVFKIMTDQLVNDIGKKLYDKYSRGADFEISDVEMDEEQKARLQKEKEEKLRLAAEERRRAAEEFRRNAEAEQKLQEERERLVREREEEQRRISASAKSSEL